MKVKVLFINLLVTTQVFAAATESARCSLRQDSLGSDLANGRATWAIKCFPDLKWQANDDGQFYLYDAQNNTQLLGYPSFVKLDANQVPQAWIAPTDANAGCVDPQIHKFVGFCRAGCYTPDQMVLFSDGYQAIGAARQSKRDDIVSVSTDSTIDQIAFQVSELKSYTVDPQEKMQDIVVIKTEEGGELKVTLNHPLVVSSGQIKEARQLKVGDKLITEEGTFEPIRSLETVKYFGKVLNVEMTDQNSLNNIVVAQGYLNGSVMYQNKTLKEVNRQVLRTLIPDTAL
jgi:hypothetical protein